MVSMRFPACLLCCCALLLTGCDSQPPQPVDLSLSFTCDTRGKLEPCGCFVGQFGGLTRLKTLLDSEPEGNRLRLDVGDATSGHEDFDEIQYRHVVQAFAQMQYDVLNVGAREAGFSPAQLRKLRQESPVPIISANLLDKSTGQLLFEPFILLERAGRHIAVLGVLDPSSLKGGAGEGLETAEMTTVLARYIPELRKKADLLIVLAFTDESTLSKLADQFFEPDIFLGGNVSQPAQELKRVNKSLVYYVTNEARTVGRLRLRLSPNERPAALANEIVFLHDKIPQDRAIATLAKAARAEIRKTRLKVDDPAFTQADAIPGVRRAASYTGSERCIECHKQAGAVWHNSGHARAFNSLIAREADADPNCIACHTIGFGSPTGYLRNAGREKFIDVGCESCHGPGSLHVKQREGDKSIDFRYRPLGAGDCLKCHHGEFSRPFDWELFWPVIRHGKESPVQAGLSEGHGAAAR
jgi:hypothetical protein